MVKFPGLYVRETNRDSYHGIKYSQAAARARRLADEYGRSIEVFLCDVEGHMEPVLTVMPSAARGDARLLSSLVEKAAA